jgi:hypothetical protein
MPQRSGQHKAQVLNTMGDGPQLLYQAEVGIISYQVGELINLPPSVIGKCAAICQMQGRNLEKKIQAAGRCKRGS